MTERELIEGTIKDIREIVDRLQLRLVQTEKELEEKKVRLGLWQARLDALRGGE